MGHNVWDENKGGGGLRSQSTGERNWEDGCFLMFTFEMSRIGGSIPIVFSYFSEFLAQEKRGEHLSWLCMFWMIGGVYAAAMAWAIIPHYGKLSDSQSSQLCRAPCFSADSVTIRQGGVSRWALLTSSTAGGCLSSCVPFPLCLPSGL
jgi:hypothetical protein